MPIDQVYEKLNGAMSLRGFITVSVAIFDEAVDELINRVFRKTDFVVKSVVDSLFETSGPLSDLSIRLKVLLGLGIVEQPVFADILHFIGLKETLNNDEKDYDFSDDIILDFARHLHLLEDKQLLDFPPEAENQDSLLYQIKRRRKEKVIRSSLILTITDIYERLQTESPL
ncbi:MltR family transcriptional regulator [Aggregatibacter actinomycetemcomitans]|uniref:MltR family transcriptional regulator n=1 Tax=Aggregatibacter actinomycetemcomitans TaxID=714 RepID=UPI00023FFA0E|nr:MltR family transcriptional regulator [Aggregatibacter actinomycetemcomitans]EHK89524.1 mannitol repressor protein [Aggregatibacter actinomycetemcomitans RhAA1]KNE76628.1 mannitol repressor protein [Aggregatibacter actinomycetemcomitans RhAA1]